MRFFAFLPVLIVTIMLSACASTPPPEAKTVPEMTFDHVVSLPVNVVQIEIVNDYKPDFSQNGDVVSFPTPPDIALRRYAEKKFRAAGPENTLKFVIEDAHVTHHMVPETDENAKKGFIDGLFGDEMEKDRYDVAMKVRLYTVAPDGAESVHSLLTVNQSVAISAQATLAEREWEQFKFLEQMMKTIDLAVTQTVKDKMNLAVVQ